MPAAPRKLGDGGERRGGAGVRQGDPLEPRHLARKPVEPVRVDVRVEAVHQDDAVEDAAAREDEGEETSEPMHQTLGQLPQARSPGVIRHAAGPVAARVSCGPMAP